MNLFELIIVLLAMIGGIGGAIRGNAIYGLIGAAFGVVAGIIGGIAVGFLLVIFLAAIFSVLTRQPFFLPKKPPRSGS